MSSTYNIASLIEDVVDTMRTQYSCSFSYNPGSNLIVNDADHTAEVNDIVIIDDNIYRVLTVSSNEFTVDYDTGEEPENSYYQFATPYFMFGHPEEIVTRLIEKDGVGNYKYAKYPLIVLLTDFDEDTSRIEGDVETSLNIVIINMSDVLKYADQRNTENFIAILEPLYREFIEAIEDSNLFTMLENGQHTKTNRYFWAVSSGYAEGDRSRLQDPIDAIEIKNLRLRVNKFC